MLGLGSHFQSDQLLWGLALHFVFGRVLPLRLHLLIFLSLSTSPLVSWHTLRRVPSTEHGASRTLLPGNHKGSTQGSRVERTALPER